MTDKREKRKAAVERVYERADAARITIADLCQRCGISPVTASRGRTSGEIGIGALRKLETAIVDVERERAAA